MKLLFIGDIYGAKGLEAIDKFLPSIKRDHPYHVLLANGENMADGLGIRKNDYKALMERGVHGVTLGNHAFSKKELFDFIDEANIVRPANYPPSTPGKTVLKINHNDQIIAIINIMGQVFMHDPLADPFTTLDALLEGLEADVIIVDVHAETTSEKLAIAHYLDGRVDAILGTHTHVPTNDAMQLPKGSLYITDVGMTGVKFGILGADKDIALRKFTTKLPTRLVPSAARELQLNAVFIDLDNRTIIPINKSD